MSQKICAFQFSPPVVALAESRANERRIEQWQPNSDLSALNQNEAADSPSPAVVAAVAAAMQNANRYPDHRGKLLRDRLSQKLRVEPDQLIFGNGSYELISMILQVSLHKGSEIAVPDPTYKRYFESALLAQATFRPVPLRADGSNDPDALIATSQSAHVLVVCTPNNPTGAALTSSELRKISASLSADQLLIVDEAYGDFSRAEGGMDALEELRNSPHAWIVIRTLSKAHGLAGMRFGYAVASHSEVTHTVDGVRGLFNVGRIAQAAALAAIEDEAWSAQIIQRTIAERKRLKSLLDEAGFSSLPSSTNFLAVRMPRLGLQVQQHLRSAGILTSLIPGKAYESYVRISVGTSADTDRVMQALKSI